MLTISGVTKDTLCNLHTSYQMATHAGTLVHSATELWLWLVSDCRRSWVYEDAWGVYLFRFCCSIICLTSLWVNAIARVSKRNLTLTPLCKQALIISCLLLFQRFWDLRSLHTFCLVSSLTELEFFSEKCSLFSALY